MLSKKSKWLLGCGIFFVLCGLMTLAENWTYFTTGSLPNWSIETLRESQGDLPGAIRLGPHRQKYSQVLFTYSTNRFIKPEARPETPVDAIFVPLGSAESTTTHAAKFVLLRSKNYTKVGEIPGDDRDVTGMDVSVSYKEAIPDDIYKLVLEEYPQFTKDQFVILDQAAQLPSRGLIVGMILAGGACVFFALKKRPTLESATTVRLNQT